MTQNVYGIDIGTSNIKIYSKSKDEILNEKNIITIYDKSKVYAFGDEAYEMYEKAPSDFQIIHPIRYGVIADIKNMETLLNRFINKLRGKLQAADFCIAVPTDITEVEKRAFHDLVRDSKVKAKNIYVMEKPVADGVGVGIDVNSPRGNLIVNFGADTTEITVLSLGGIVISKLLKTGGNRLDELVCSMVRKKYNLIIGMKTAEQLKICLGNAILEDVADNADAGDNSLQQMSMKVYGRDLVKGLPVVKEILATDVCEAIKEPIFSVISHIKLILERTPPELAADIIDTGIYITGGSSKLHGFDKLLHNETELTINVQDEPSECVVKGISKILAAPEHSGLMYVPHERVIN